MTPWYRSLDYGNSSNAFNSTNGRSFFNPLDSKSNYSATSNNTKLVRWPLRGGLWHLVQRGGAWAGCGPAQSPPRCTKCNSLPINSLPINIGQCTNHCMMIRSSPLLCCFNVATKGLNFSCVMRWQWRLSINSILTVETHKVNSTSLVPITSTIYKFLHISFMRYQIITTVKKHDIVKAFVRQIKNDEDENSYALRLRGWLSDCLLDVSFPGVYNWPYDAETQCNLANSRYFDWSKYLTRT